ncbi:MAG: YraN family protein [Phycisphaerae bacterium]|nr:YraN family protein [Phycisphaerae bacterium]
MNWLRLRRSPPHLRLGRRGERRARRYLAERGHRVLARNFHCPAGEIDLITLDGDNVVFVEVKTRASEEHQPLDETVSRQKWLRVERTARWFLAHRRLLSVPCRFDLVLVLWPPGGKPVIEHFPDAYRRGE